jgi:hypothetical protein
MIILTKNTALALATPVRICTLTDAVLPRYFMQDFNLVSHPQSGDPWWISPSLAKSRASQIPSSAVNSAPEVPGSKAAEKRRPVGPTGYILSRQGLLREIQESRSPHSRGNKKILRKSKSRSMNPAVGARAVWREDMDSFILDMMRRRIVEDLVYYAKMSEHDGRSYIVKCESWDEVKTLKHRGCVLWMEPVSKDNQTEVKPGQLATMDIEGVRFGAKLVVHNLDELLGEDHLAALRNESAMLRSGNLFLLGRQRTLDLQLKLWKLQGYMDNP